MLTTEVLLIVVFFWAFAEAIVWPVMPDAILVPVCVAQPGHAFEFVCAATIGTIIGGALSYWIADRFEQLKLTRLPLVRAAMIDQACNWLVSEGPRGVLHQGLSALPFKVFARLAGGLKVPVVPFLFWSAVIRGTRFAVVAALSALGAILLPEVVQNNGTILFIVWMVIFVLGLRGAVRYWERR